jgi:ABC-type antimicrobial peptide transport system permease subunit
VGVVTGRALWRAFASSLGVVPDPTTSSIAVVLVVLAGVVAAVVAALIPSHLATRVSPAAGLRAE